MPRYFFHIDDGQPFRDADGTVLPDVEAARVEATRVLAHHLKDHPRQLWHDGVLTVTVQDQAGLTLFMVTVSGHEAAAMSRAAGDQPSPG